MKKNNPTRVIAGTTSEQTVVDDHSSANTSSYNKNNIEVQGLKRWPSGVNSLTGNGRTEKTIGTLKREEIYLQEQYAIKMRPGY